MDRVLYRQTGPRTPWSRYDDVIVSTATTPFDSLAAHPRLKHIFGRSPLGYQRILLVQDPLHEEARGLVDVDVCFG